MPSLIYLFILLVVPAVFAENCGSKFGSCPAGQCCSEYNWCGTGSAWCGAGCQSAFGTCSNSGGTTKPTAATTKPPTTTTAVATKPTTTPPTVKPATTTATSAPTTVPGQVISTDGKCGPGLRCPSDEACCSKYGWCGSSAAHCGTGCQIAYGVCAAGNPTTTSAPAATTKPASTTAPTSTPKPASNVRVVTKCSVPNTVAITFDDGPYQYIEQISQAFLQAGGKTTFFVNGLNWGCIYDKAEALKAVYEAGHQVGSHTWSHPDITTLSNAQLTTEMNSLSVAFKKILGAVPIYMRPPFGYHNAANDEVLRQLGFSTIVIWDVDPGDSLGASTADQQKVYNSAATGTSHITLQHETQVNTVNNMVPFVINWAKQRNLKMVTVAECLGETTASAYTNLGGAETRNSNWVC